MSGPLDAVIAVQVDLLVEVAVHVQVGPLHGALELKLAPLAANLGLAQRLDQQLGLLTSSDVLVRQGLELLVQTPSAEGATGEPRDYRASRD
ncbi:hypothetical protein SM418_37255 [Actinomadura chokoriensis]|uniref:Uncharacterized protein n=1 Tax=Actinomadura chokoriensis TaxID=454156 RepID=A0ABV4RC59_9ACTN